MGLRSSMAPGGAGFAVLFTVFAAVFEVAFYSGMASKVSEQRASASWPGVQGTVVSAKVIEKRGRRGARTFRPHIEYDYTVNATTHRSNRYRAINDWRKTTLAAEIVARHAPGTAVTVYYDPSDPARALLSPGPSWADTGAITIVRVFMWVLPVAGWAAVAFRAHRKSRRDLVSHY